MNFKQSLIITALIRLIYRLKVAGFEIGQTLFPFPFCFTDHNAVAVFLHIFPHERGIRAAKDHLNSFFSIVISQLESPGGSGG